MAQKDFPKKINSQLLEEISDNSAVGAGWGWGWARLSPISNALGNKVQFAQVQLNVKIIVDNNI